MTTVPDGSPDTTMASVDTGRMADAGLFLPFEVTPPNLPWLEAGEPPIAPPVLTPCAEGWHETELVGVTVCEPWPEGRTHNCPLGEAQLLGNVDCVPLGGACPLGDFADGLPTDRPVLYVQASAELGGDGSAGEPYGTLAAALATDPVEGSVLALSTGIHEGALMPPGLTLVGTCAGRTVLVAPPGADAALQIDDGTLEVRSLRIEPGEAKGLVATGATTRVALHAVEVTAAQCTGIEMRGASSLDAETLVVRNTAGCADLAIPHGGLRIIGAGARVRGSLLLANGDFGILMDEGSPAETAMGTLVLEDTVVRDHPSETARFPKGTAVLVQAPATVEVRRVLFEGNGGGSLQLVGDGVVGSVDDTLARANGSVPYQPFGEGAAIWEFAVARGASVALRRSVVRGMRTWPGLGAVSIMNSEVSSTMEDVVIAENKVLGLRVLLHQGGVFGRRVVIAHNAAGAANAISGVLELSDARLRDDLFRDQGVLLTTGESLPNQSITVGAWLGAPAHLGLRNAVVGESFSSGILMSTAGPSVGASLVLEDVAVVDTLGVTGSGRAIEMASGTEFTARHVLLERNHLAALETTNGGGRVVLEDVVIRDVQPYPDGEVGGRAITLSAGSTAVLRRSHIDGTYEMGIAAFGSTLTLEDVEVHHSRASACAGRGTCLAHGHALGIYAGSVLTAERFVLGDAFTCGVHFATGAEVDLSSGHVTRTRIGACVQVDGYDVERLSNGVFYTDNERNLDATALPVPDPGG